MNKKLIIVFIIPCTLLWVPKALSITQSGSTLPHLAISENQSFHAQESQSSHNGNSSSKKIHLNSFLHAINHDIMKRLDWQKTFSYYQILFNQSVVITSLEWHKLFLSARLKLLQSLFYLVTTLFPEAFPLQKNSTTQPLDSCANDKRNIPIITYIYSQKDPITQEYIPKKELSCKLADSSWIIENINKYFISPQQNYLLVQRNNYDTFHNRIIARMFPPLYDSEPIFELFNIEHPDQIIASFKTIVTHIFSPQEKSIVIATADLTGIAIAKGIFGLNKADKKGALECPPGTIPLRGVKGTNEIFQHKLFDIASRKYIQIFENIQALHFIDEDHLFAAYDNGATECISIIRSKTPYVVKTLISWLCKELSFKIPEPRTPSVYPKIMFDHAKSTLQVQPLIGSKKVFINTNYYQISPHRKFLLIHAKPSGICNAVKNMIGNKQSLTTVLDIRSGTIITTIPNIINYRFNNKETKLKALTPDNSWLSKSLTGIQNTLHDIEPNRSLLPEAISEPEKHKNQALYDDLPDALKKFVPRDNILHSDNEFFDQSESSGDDFYFSIRDS